MLAELKSEMGCLICGERDPRCLDFHHIDPETKVLPVSMLLQYSFEYVLEEASKCVLLCSNCHRKEHG
jgi:hypothetical protein